MKRPEQEAELKQRFGAGRGGKGAVEPKPVEDLHPPIGQQHNADEQHLTAAKITGDRNLGGGVNTTRLVTFEDGSKGIFKPQSGANSDQMRGNIRPGQDMQREIGAYQVAKAVGMTDLVPATVARTVNGEAGSMQQFVAGAKEAAGAANPYDGRTDFARAATFDYVIGNEDRHMGNWMVKSDGKLNLIDHGLSFPESHTLSSTRGFMRKAPDQGYGRTPSVFAKPYVDNKAAILSSLSALQLPKSAVDGVSHRIDQLAGMTSRGDWSVIASGGRAKVKW
jgi:hypothetical protein